jgi:UDP-N-acetylmuramate dehydrogenase
MSTPPTILQPQISLASKTWFKTGGLAAWYAEPSSLQELQSSIIWAAKEKLPIFVLGKGANILISDDGFPGLVIHPKFTSITHTKQSPESVFVKAGAGVSIDELIAYCLENNLTGLEEFSAIPGTVGGSVFINIHYFTASLSDFLHSATILHMQTGEIRQVEKSWFNFGYDYSTLHQEPYMVIDATFCVKEATDTQTAFAQGRAAEIARHRKQRYPYEGTCGSFFKNFSPKQVTRITNGKKAIWVAYYLDQLGVKGELCSGGACVSHKHANMIVNTGNASSNDIITLARTMQEMMLEKFNLLPEPECQLIGFTTWPLKKSN